MLSFYNKKSGFSLVEMLVAVAIFMSIMTIAISSLISIINATKRAQSIKNTIDSVNFALENVSRDMRIGSDYKCLSDGKPSPNTGGPVSPEIKDCSAGSTIARYENSSGNIITYTFNGKDDSTKGVLTRTTCPLGVSSCSPSSDNTVDLISQDSNVTITNMVFYVIGADCEYGTGLGCTRKTQPGAIITASGLISAKGSLDTAFNLQTHVMQRAIR